VKRGFAATVLLLSALSVSAGCVAGTRGSTGSAGGTPESVSITASQTVTATAPPADPPADAPASGGGSAPTAAPDIKSIDAELKAMQNELDGLALPADSDFSSAEGALY
jgi:hypothetical protein